MHTVRSVSTCPVVDDLAEHVQSGEGELRNEADFILVCLIDRNIVIVYVDGVLKAQL